MAPADPLAVMDSIFLQVTTTDSVRSVAKFLREMSPRELRDAALASPLSSGQDPLAILSVEQNTLAILYILVARLHLAAQPPPFDIIEGFCRHFNPDHARHAPERVTLLAKGIQRLALSHHNPKAAILPLYHLIIRYRPDPSYLTTIHPIFVLTCLQATSPSSAIPILRSPITSIDTNLSDLTYNDNLMYHYTGGIALAMLKHWEDAEEFFEICVTAPGTVPAALQLEALKKLRLVQLISKGKVSPLPKYTHPLLQRHFKTTPYSAFITAYPQNGEALKEILQKDRNLFTTEKNMGLLRQAIDRAPRWVLKKLTATYLSLNLADIGKAIKVESEVEVRQLLLDMIEFRDISATIAADGSVTFSDPPPQFTRNQVDLVLRDVQEQSALLEYLEKDIAKSKEFLSKAVKGRDGDGFGVDEDVFSHLGGVPGGPGGQMWAGEEAFGP